MRAVFRSEALACMSDLPERIGPYKILGRLGSGGMGEVFLAQDDDLNRRVAIKRVRPTEADNPERRERFRREAKLAAQLNHPAIVQIYHVIPEADGETIVMEYVRGRTLREQVESSGPLPIDEVLRIGRDVASGLAEAHRHGIVHRDLKSENVMITADGYVKIADFGVAKRLLREEDHLTLTKADAVLGTCRSMSPEQAAGQPADHRSDLFSFGVLLYELATGTSPFRGDNDLATLHRVIHEMQSSANAIRPEIPEDVADLIDHLLEKEPAHRPRGAAEVASILSEMLGGSSTGFTRTRTSSLSRPPHGSKRGFLRPLLWAGGAAVVVMGAVLLLGKLLTATPVSVAIPTTELQSAALDEVATHNLGESIRMALVRALTDLQGVLVLPSDEIDPLAGTPVEIGHRVAADEVLASKLDCQDSPICQVTLERVDLLKNRIVWAQTFEIASDDPHALATATIAHTRQGYSDRRLRPGAVELRVRAEDYAEFVKLYNRDRSALADVPREDLLNELEDLRNSSPYFVEVHLLEASIYIRQYGKSRDLEDYRRAKALMDEACRLAPQDTRAYRLQFRVASKGGDTELARRALDTLRAINPGDPTILTGEAELLEADGKTTEALALIEEAVDRRPSWLYLWLAADMEARLGRTVAARAHLERLLERKPDDIAGLSLLGQIELTEGDPSQAAEIYSRLSSRTENYANLTNLGVSYFLLGRYAEAIEAFERAHKWSPRNAWAVLNLADAYQIQGQIEEAKEAYAEVVTLVNADSGADNNWQLLSAKAQALAHLGDAEGAMAAIQVSLRLAPDDIQAAYEASLVFALVGDRQTALFHANRALERGYGARWFRFPWFESLRSSEGFRRLVYGEATESGSGSGD